MLYYAAVTPMTDQFHVVKRDAANEADILKYCDAQDIPWAIYRRDPNRPELRLGLLVAAFWSEDMAIVTCRAMNACGDFIRTMLED